MKDKGLTLAVLPETAPTRQRSVILTNEQWAWLDVIAKQRGLAASTMLRVVVSAYMDAWTRMDALNMEVLREALNR